MDFSSNFASFDAQRTASLVQEMEQNGYAVLNDFLTNDQLIQARTYLMQEVNQRDREFFAIHGVEAMEGSPLAGLATSTAFRQLLADLYRVGAGVTACDDEQIFPVIRCLQGKSGLKESHFYHFDATLVTALVPLFIPSGDANCGDLISFPNIRGARRNVVVNILEKAILHNKLSQKFTAMAVKRGWLKPITLKLVPGNAYLFWGYRSLHANDQCDPHKLRATALYHFGDPHRGSLLGRLLLGSNKRHAQLDHNGMRPVTPPAVALRNMDGGAANP
jgi:hypothetical protein